MPNTKITPANMIEIGVYASLCVYGKSKDLDVSIFARTDWHDICV